ncbi:hypothetical protein [Streptomyces sp. NPDC058614]|uniref:hypothetical protein n=1 Tax=Streptomyces sp. NPDC058614 TaxID=3346557 RepID=UPI003646FF03
MAKPQGATKVTYSFANAPSEASVEFTFDVVTLTGEVDAAMEAGANAILAHLQAAYPTRTILATRTYSGSLAGDAWPAS